MKTNVKKLVTNFSLATIFLLIATLCFTFFLNSNLKPSVYAQENNSFSIEKSFDLNSVEFADGQFTYDGIPKSLKISGNLPTGISVTYVGNNAVNAGTYTVKANFYDANGNIVGFKTASLTINKADYDMSGVQFNDKEVVYDGNVYKLEITGTLPAGVSVIYIDKYNFSTGTHTVTANFYGDSLNYNAIPSKTATLTIKNSQVTDYEGTNAQNFGKPDLIAISQNGFLPNVNFTIDNIDSNNNTIQKLLNKKEVIGKIYQVNMTVSGQQSDSLENVTLKLKIPSNLIDKQISICKFENSKLEKIDFTIEDGYAVMNTNSFSQFVITYNQNSLVWLIVLLSLILVAQILLTISQSLKIKKNKNNQTESNVKLNGFSPLVLAGVFIPSGSIVAISILGLAVVGITVTNVILGVKLKNLSNKDNLATEKLDNQEVEKIIQISETSEGIEQTKTEPINNNSLLEETEPSHNIDESLNDGEKDQCPQEAEEVVENIEQKIENTQESCTITQEDVKQEVTNIHSNEQTVETEDEVVEKNIKESLCIEEQPQKNLPNEDVQHTIDEKNTGVIKLIDGKEILVRYNRSFTAKLIQNSEETKDFFCVLKNYIYQFNKVRCRMGWKYVSFSSGRKMLAKLTIRGKTLTAHLALFPEDLEGVKIKVTDMSNSKTYEKVPATLKVKSNRALNNAKKLVDILMQKLNLSSGASCEQTLSSHFPYQDTKSLISVGLIKVKAINGEEINDSHVLVSTRPFAIHKTITVEEAHNEISDEVAFTLVEHTSTKNKAGKKFAVNIDQLSQAFSNGDEVTLEKLQEKGLVPKNEKAVKILARGMLDKALTVYADAYSADAIKMIVLVGGTVKEN